MDIKMIVCDLDRTLLDKDKEVSGRTLAALEGLRERGILVGIATARHESSARRVTDVVRPDVMIFSGGAVAKVRGEVVFESLLSVETTKALAATFAGLDETGYITMVTADGYFINKQWPVDEWRDFNDGVIVDFAGVADLKAEKIMLQIPIGLAKEIAKEYPDTLLTPYSGEDWVQYSCKDATKWGAVAAVAGHLGIDASEIAAFGDDFNDAEMIEKCGIGVAMGNAIDEVKAVADYITVSNDEDGVAVWLEENVL